MRKMILATALCSISMTVSYARAAEKQMPIDFVGEWCTPSKDGNSAEYTLPSWTDDGKCTEILSVEKWGFSFNDQTCIPADIRTSRTPLHPARPTSQR
jgi:hypothetical protein